MRNIYLKMYRIIKSFSIHQKTTAGIILFSILYLLLISFMEGLQIENCVIVVIYNLCYFARPGTRRFILAFSIFVVFAILYDMMKIYPNYLFNQVDISGLFHFEQKLFGFNKDGVFYTLNQYFAIHNTPFLDLISGMFYMNWIPVPLAFALYLYVTNKQQFLHFSLTFFLVNLLGFCIYYIHPAAPPWYVDLYHFNLQYDIPGNTAGLARFDKLVHFPIFQLIYARNSNVFAALPSLHSAYPVVVLYYGIKNKFGWINCLLVLFMAGIWFAAVYSGHHYVTDVIAGIICAGIGLLIFQKVLLNTAIFQKWITNYEQLI